MTQHFGASNAFDWLQAIIQPQRCLGWHLQDWERVIRLSRRLRLLGRLAESVAGAGLLEAVPTQAARHLSAEMTLSRWQTGALVWLLDRLGAMLGPVPYPLVLLKGGAYIAQDLDIAKGRLPSDADILVPREFIGQAQHLLRHRGWVEAELDAHDQRYYHQWSHEVPPMRHPMFSLELDLHHNILPPLGRVRVDAELLLSRLVPSKWPQWQVLHPVDQVLHSAAHLFFDSDIRDRLRDLVDLDGLMRQFAGHPGFWQALPERGRELGLSEPLALAAHHCARWLRTPIPQDCLQQIERHGPSVWRRQFLHPILGSLLTPVEPDATPRWTQSVSAQMFLVRHHLGRLPLHLLVPHLWHKLQTRVQSRAAPAATDDRR